jgi:hypothetical protein
LASSPLFSLLFGRAFVCQGGNFLRAAGGPDTHFVVSLGRFSLFFFFSSFFFFFINTNGFPHSSFQRFDAEEAKTAGILASIAYCPIHEIRRNKCDACKALGEEFEILYVSGGLGDTLM